jgi:hypothetical protein
MITKCNECYEIITCCHINYYYTCNNNKELCLCDICLFKHIIKNRMDCNSIHFKLIIDHTKECKGFISKLSDKEIENLLLSISL